MQPTRTKPTTAENDEQDADNNEDGEESTQSKQLRSRKENNTEQQNEHQSQRTNAIREGESEDRTLLGNCTETMEKSLIKTEEMSDGSKTEATNGVSRAEKETTQKGIYRTEKGKYSHQHDGELYATLPQDTTGK